MDHESLLRIPEKVSIETEDQRMDRISNCPNLLNEILLNKCLGKSQDKGIYTVSGSQQGTCNSLT